MSSKKGGSGVVPLMSMLRHRANADPGIRAALLYSSRSPEEVIYGTRLEQWTAGDANLHVVHTFTREPPSGWSDYTRRVDRRMLADVIRHIGAPLQVYVCGPDGFVEAVADALVGLNVAPAIIHMERFGPSGTLTTLT
jgi:ferredoxin-NADP reductase